MNNRKTNLYNPKRWGLLLAAIRTMGDRLFEFWERYSPCFRTQTHDGSPYAHKYLSGLLRRTEPRNFTNIGRQTGVAGQNVQHFMSNWPWSAHAVIEQVQQELMSLFGLPCGGMLLLDESACEKAGDHRAGAGRQYNGRWGSVQMSQVGTFLAYGNGPLWTWIDGELFLPEHWFSKKMAPLRKRLGIPKARKFATKIQLGWQMIQRVQQHGVRFEAVGCDTLYGRSVWLRRQMAGAGILYIAEVPADTHVYLTPPVVGLPKKKKSRGREFTRPRILSKEKPIEVRALARRSDTVWSRVCVRTIERGELHDEFAVRRVWTSHNGEPPVEEWLVMRRYCDGDLTYRWSVWRG